MIVALNYVLTKLPFIVPVDQSPLARSNEYTLICGRSISW